MEQWLKDNFSDETTRSFDVVLRLHRLQQREDQKFNTFLDVYKAIEAELPYELPDLYCVYALLDKL
jgi:hypothetical protein